MPGGENSQWYKSVKKGSPLEQGDVLFGFSIPSISFNEDKITNSEITSNFVILNQSCDLIVQDGKSKPRAERYLLAEAQELHIALKKYEEIHKGRNPGLYALPRRLVKKEPKTHLVVNFNRLHAIDFNLATDIFNLKRVRILSPYREHLMQAFSTTYSRVALDNPPDFM